MQQLQFVKKRTLEWSEVPEPKITGKNQALVKPLAVSRCDLDLPILRGQTLFRPPFPVGHEFVGEIVQTSSEITDLFPVGTRVAVPFQISCGYCHYCETGQSKSCSTVSHTSAYGMGKGGKEFGGALSDLVGVPYAKEMLVPFSSKTDPAAIASINDNLVESWKLAGLFLNQNKNLRILILGGFASSIGLYTAALSKHMGAAEIVYLDADKKRLDLAASFGVRVEQVAKFPKSFGKFDIVADASGSPEGWDCGLRSLDVDGIFGSASIFWTNTLPIPYLDLYNNGASIRIGRVRSREWIPEILRLVEEEGFDPSKVTTKKASWKDAAEAFLEEETKLIVVR
ncbi:alcohol dehydrogenase, catalytic domain, GroES-like family [Leptospira fainei serovar Hurstbridge str. BUT 6]|uniref:Alcohol dehydrogenase, catalytic domain, GroES-like family n=1 Tax=Leptospira fainei serovar Hurstbridge str. BUT 6 TaxID=1193011 RepID=S3VZ32_9LEPT|nr:alcohol dehydrogenase catalytic domain-containing protein [Leptospira fainei]EPG73347.1 alcohol dehydrogenase, catalytic domain, GroES-like family [Leptospira fainei serovar Hurstbridge str. BUT 6]